MPSFLELAQNLTQALKSLQMYQSQHPRSQEALGASQRTLEAWLEDKPSMQLNVSNGKAFVDGQPQEGVSPHVQFLVKQLSDRHLAGFVFERGFSAEELLGLLESLLMKPQRIDEAGGLAGILDARGLRRIRVSATQYREVGSDEPYESGAYLASGAFSASGAYKVPEGAGRAGSGEHAALHGPGNDPELLLGALRETLLTLMQNSSEGLILPKPGETSPLAVGAAPAAVFPELGLKLGMAQGGAAPTQSQLGILRQVALSLPAPQQLSLISGLGSAPPESQGLATGLRSMVPELLATAIATLLKQGYQWSQLEDSVSKILKPFADRAAIAASTGVYLQGMGVDAGPLGGLVQNMDWEEVSLQSKVGKLLEEGKLLEISSDHRLAFLRDLLEKRMDEAFLRGLEQLLEGLKSETLDVRRSAAQTLAGVARWALEPRLPAEAEKLLRQRLPRPFLNETDEGIHRWISEALSEMVLVWVEQGELTQGTQAVVALRTRMEAAAAAQPWRIKAMAEFEARILSARGRQAALLALFRTEREQLLVEVEPFLRWQGPPMAKLLMDRLAVEQDRTKRGRLMDGIRLMGDMAVPYLDEVLKNPSWFVVRNGVLLMAELGTQTHMAKVLPLLRHAEPRVCHTAVRAIWKLGGPASEQALLNHLRDAEPGTQAEILFALGQIRGDASGPALAELAADRKVPERLRLEALKTLMSLRSVRSVPTLVELIRRKGIFGAGAEAGSVRVAAAQALASVGTPDAKEALKRLVDAEPRGAEREAMSRLLGA